ncbi:hypothetical protein ABZX77_09280 [Streptomyces sp. NPDC004237]|uniref:hypothetical protein n=1 Tax=Streptomyces sp. NPDC004237 TaxID=3154455 RepID=UPI0033BC2AA5
MSRYQESKIREQEQDAQWARNVQAQARSEGNEHGVQRATRSLNTALDNLSDLYALDRLRAKD